MITIARIPACQLSVLCIALLTIFPTLAEAAVAGRVQFVAGDVRILDEKGKERVAQKGLDVSEGETVTTAANSSAQLKMVDGATLAMRPSTQMKVEVYAFNGSEDGSENATLSLFKGGMRAITGLIGTRSKEKFKLRTPNATIGIRGTDHEPVVVLPPGPGETSDIPAGTYDKVNVGATSLTTQAGTTTILPNQVGFAASPTQFPVILPKMPDFYQATATPQAKGEQKQDKQEKQQAQETTQQKGEAAKAEAVSDTPVLAALPVGNLSGTDPNGNSLNVSTQTLTTPDGDVLGVDAKPFRAVGITDGWGEGFSRDGINFDIRGLYRGSVAGDIQPTGQVVDNKGGLLGFSGRVFGYSPVDSTAPSPDPTVEKAANIRIGSAVNRDVGSVKLGGITVTWGRWEGGAIDIYSPDGSAKLGTINNSNRSAHWITTSSFGTADLQLPLTGTASYTVVGSTSPTDLLGNTGTLGKVTLKADFANAKVDASLNVSFNSPTNTSDWSMTANNMPLSSKEGFKSNGGPDGIGAIVPTVSCTGRSCGSYTTGGIDGHILGNTQGAIMTYSMATGVVEPAILPTPGTPGTPGTPPTPGKPETFVPSNVVTGLVILKR